MSTYPTTMAKPAQIRSALRFYRVMAIIAGIALFVLIAAMFIMWSPQNPSFSAVWSPIHGLIYLVYAASIANLGLKSAWSLKRIVLNLLTGFVPILPFVAEARVTRSTEALLSRVYLTGDAGTDG